jgi:site-specific DNA recombinase
MMGAVLYLRVSTSEQANENYSLPTQEKKTTELSQRMNLSVLATFKDRDSARTDDRPQFQKMLKFCKENSRKISHVIVADLSRLARNVLDQGQTVVTLGELGIKLLSVDEPNLDESAAGKLLKNVLGSMNQFFSDSLSEKTKSRMKAGVEKGRWLWIAPIGYKNLDKQIIIDPERSGLVIKAFELVASRRFTTVDAVRRQITALGLTSRKGRPVTKQSFARMLSNPFYAGWILSSGDRYQGVHTPLIEEQLFQQVQDRLNGKSVPHVSQNEDFPLRRFVKCSVCGKPITAGWAKGRKEHYARYWCWTKGCHSVKISRDKLELHFVLVLGSLEPTAQYLAQLPDIARREWALRKEQISTDATTLSKRMADQKTLNQKAVIAKLNGEMSVEDFQIVKQSVTEEMERIQAQINLLDSEKSSMQDLIQQSNAQVLNFVEAWRKAGIRQKQELQWALFPEGLTYSHGKRFFEPANVSLMQAFRDLFDSLSNVGVPDGI